jgi:putative ABC transport system permease protein
MRVTDLIKLAFGALGAYRLRSFLTALGIAVGIAAVILLTSIGAGVQRFVLGEFTQFGTNLLAITPGKSSTFGLSGAMIHNVRPLSLEDALAMDRLPAIQATVPVVQGNAAVEAPGGRSRRTAVFGVGAAAPEVWRWSPLLGSFLPDDPPRYARPLAVLGHKVRLELFGGANPLGERVRIGGESYRVVGTMRPKGQILGFDLDDAVFIPAHRALSLFNQESLMEVDLLYRPGSDSRTVAEQVRRAMIERHGGEDFTLITQDQMLDTLGDILGILTLAVGALGGISLLVGGVGILTIMTISLNERTAEIGLLRALGAPRRQILQLFLGEAVALAAAGGLAGVLLGVGGGALLHAAVPALPVHTPWNYALLALLVSALIGLAAGVVPAWRAAQLDPIEALRTE